MRKKLGITIADIIVLDPEAAQAVAGHIAVAVERVKRVEAESEISSLA